MTDWVAWHDAYADEHSDLSRRLGIVRGMVREALPQQPAATVRALSICAGRGDDLVHVLREYEFSRQVRGRLVELDPDNAQALREAVHAAGLDLEVVEGDAGDLTAYDGAVPADLVLLCGVLGNVSDEDARTIVRSMPRLCAAGATVIWTRARRPPDLTPRIREWFADAGFSELAFVAPEDALFSVGMACFSGAPRPLGRGRLFRFAR
jgi:ubiquinone/menaquinone biosynthesis C-methylase UbiE